MKKLFFVLVILMSLYSCSNTPLEETKVENPSEVTNLEMQSATKDTVLILNYNSKIYVFDQNNTLKYEINAYDPVNETPIHILVAFLGMIGCVALIVFIVVNLFN